MHFLGGYLALFASALSLTVAGPLAERAGNFNNPVLWQDYPDLEIIRIGDVFYYTSSTFAYSPGAPVLKSYDLVNWTPVSHSMPTVPGSQYNNNKGYVKGIWASSLRYRNSTDTFHWIGCIDGRTYIQTASGTNAAKNNGEVSSWNWKSASTINSCYYDCGLLVDNDDTIYVAYGNTKINVAQLNKDGTSQVKSQQVYSDGTTIEGSRMYRIKDWYYIAVTKPASEEWILKSKSPWGPYEKKVLIGNTSPIASSGAAHQGGLIDTKDGQWYYAAFLDAYPGGRIPVLAPLTWSSDGWPSVVKDGNSWGKSYPMPVSTAKTVPPITGTDNFQGSSLSHEWEWNHNPDTSKYKLAGGDGGLILQTATVTSDIFQARNTITRRIMGPKSMGTVKLDISQMKDGDRAGACLFRDVTAYIGVHKDGSASKLVMVNGITLSGNTGSAGKIAATGPTLAAGTTNLWLRIQADITPAFGTNTMRQATFWYSTDGTSFTQLGPSFGMTNAWQYFTGYRYSVFNFASKALGGQVTAKSFSMEKM